VPCVMTNCPWQPYVYGRNGDPKVGWEWTYHFFWGLEDATAGHVVFFVILAIRPRGLFPRMDG
jgi:branched-chain amino acid transport system substrate-binding protein